MTFHTVFREDLPAAQSPVRLADEQGGEIEWANRFLDAERVRGLRPLSLRSYAYALLHIVRWWARQPGVDMRHLRAEQFTESTLIDYVRDQLNEHPKPSPENVNTRAWMLRRLFQFYFAQDMPHAPYRLQRTWWCRSPLGYGRGRRAVAADLTLKVPERVIVPLSVEQVARFWASFHTTRDLALVGLLLLNGLRAAEVICLQLEDLLWSESQMRVHGKGGRERVLPLPPDTIRLLQCYLASERPRTPSTAVFVSHKGRARGQAMTPAGLRSLFRHHRQATAVPKANPHRFRHTFASDMIRAGVSLPALQRLMGHAHIQTTMLYIRLSAQDVFAEYTRAVAKITAGMQPLQL
jgi:site-specific recombinase XerD